MNNRTRVITVCAWALDDGRACRAAPAVYDTIEARFLCAAHGQQLEEEARAKAAAPQTAEESAISAAYAVLRATWHPPFEQTT